MMGTRGIPARYGGFETAVEEIGRRLAERGHDITVHCRNTEPSDRTPSYLGMRRVVLPAVRARAVETLSHTAFCVADSTLRRRFDAVLLFNAANACFLPALRLRGIPTAVHVDGLEWLRAKWNGAGRTFYRMSETLAVRWADALIADAGGIADYYRHEFGASTELLSYGAPVIDRPGTDMLGELDLEPGGFHLVVARFEPENHVEEMVRAYASSPARLPLVVVGSAPYNDRYTASIRGIAAADPRVRTTGSIWDQRLLDQLYANARLYLHGHSVGGTNPSLLRAMGAATAVAAWDVGFNREVLGPDGWFVSEPDGIAAALSRAESDPQLVAEQGRRLCERAEALYRWDEVADGYEELALRLAGGWSRAGEASGARRGSWLPQGEIELGRSTVP